ncbi:MAG: hypothetical protein Q9227_004434 [Pyrenula ochraceoflavens]
MGSIGTTTFLSDILKPKVKPLPHIDERSDEEIIRTIVNPPRVSSEQNVWAFWDKGFTAMPAWQRRNVLGWVRMLGPRWTVRVLDLVPGSTTNVRNFLDTAYLPEHVGDEKLTGKYAGAHTSDTIRLSCLFQYGGAWMDVGIILLMHLDQVCWDALWDPKSKFQVAVASGDPTCKSGTAENFFIASRKGDGFIKRWMLILLESWKGAMSNRGSHNHPLFRHLVRDGNITHVFHQASEDKLDYFQAYLAYERLRLLEDPHDGFSGPTYCKNRVLLIDYKEFALAAMLTNDNGPKQFEMFCSPYSQEDQSIPEEEYEESRKFFETILSNTAMLKLYHWRDHDVPTLADLWDKPENDGADCRAGSFGEYLRYNSARFTQDRKINVVKFPPITEQILVAGVLEIFED